MLRSGYNTPYVDGLSRVMPTVFVAGPAKSGSTFLWDCLHQSFHPQRLCDNPDSSRWSDARCGADKRFILPALAADVTQPACLRPQKESSFWRYWGRRPQMTWARYGGPRLPLSEWALDGASCVQRRRILSRRADDAGPRKFAAHRAIEDICLQETPCRSGDHMPIDRPGSFVKPLPASCLSECAPCALHAGWVNNVEAPCAISSFRCASRTCAEAPYVPKALRRANYSAFHARAFTLTAFPSLESLAAANISARRLASLEGNPGLFQTPPRHARALASLTTATGRLQLKLIIGLRDPFDLAFSLWAFLATIGQEGRRVEQRMGRALAAVQACNDSLADNPMQLLQLSPSALAEYRACLDDRPRSKQHFYLYGGLYALHLLGWLHQGFEGRQFLFVRMASLPRTPAQAAALQRELAAFLDLTVPPQPRAGSGSTCLSASMITAKSQRIRAHNASVRDVKRIFKQSPTAVSLQRFFAGHEALLRALMARERVRLF